MRTLVSARSAVVAGALALVASVVSAQHGGGLQPQTGLPSNQMPGTLQDVGFEQRLDETLPLDLPFRNEDGREVRLGEYFGDRPVLLAFVYYECPMLCSQVLNGVTSALVAIDERAGRDFDVVAVSFDPRETPPMAAAKKKSYIDRYNRPNAERGWHFLTGSEASIRALTAAAGFSTPGTSRRSSSPTPAASSSRRPRDGCRATSSASSTRRGTSSSRSSSRRRAASGRWSTRCCSTAITTTRPPGRTRSWR